MMRISIIISFFLVPFCISGQQHLVDITELSGVSHGHQSGSLIGGGVTLADINNDGWDDLLLAGGVGEDVIYLNNRDATFTKLEKELPHNRYSSKNTSSMTATDINNDGCIDIFVSNSHKQGRSYLLKGDCNGRFEEISLDAKIIETAMSVGAIVSDFTGDGLLDIYVLNYIEEEGFIESDGEVIGFNHICAPNFLYVNQGDMKFDEMAEEFQVAGDGCSLGAQLLTIDGYEKALYVVNDFGEWLEPNQLYLNDGIEYKEKGRKYGLEVAAYGMGIATGDVDGDLIEDIYITNIGANPFCKGEDDKFTQNIEHALADSITESGTAAVGWGTTFFDYDNDRDLDVIIANGDIASATFLNVQAGSSLHLYENKNGTFERLILPSREPMDGKLRGLAVSDIDHDGDQDLIVGNTSISNSGQREKGILVFENENELGNSLTLIPSEELRYSNIQVLAETESDTLIRSYYIGGSHISQGSHEILIGTGEESVLRLTVYTSAGDTLRISQPPINERLLLQKEVPHIAVMGCTDPTSLDYNPNATFSIGCVDITTNTKELYRDSISLMVIPSIIQDKATLITSKPEGILRVVDQFGVVIQQLTLDENSTHLNFSSFHSGVYYIMWQSQDKAIVERVIITH